jgi:hypothetical protein
MAILQRLLGPTDAQARQAELLKTERRTNQQLQDSTFYDNLLAKGLVNPDNHIVDFKKLVSKDDNGMYLYQDDIVALLNSSNKFRQFTDTKEGMDKLGVIEGFQDNPDGTKSIVTRRPDTRALAPKTWFASDDPNDLVANLSEKEFKTLIQGNAAIAKYRAYPNLGPAVMAQSIARSGPKNLVTGEPLGGQEDVDDPVTEAGAVASAIDDDPDINLQEANAQLVSIGEDLQKRLEQRKDSQTAVSPKTIPDFETTEGLTDRQIARKGTTFSQETATKFLQDVGVPNIPTSEGDLKKVTEDIERASEGKNAKNINKTLEALGSSRQDFLEGPRNRFNLNAANKFIQDKIKELEFKEPQLTSVPDIEIQGELKPDATAEEVQTFFEANEKSLRALSQDGDLVNRIRQVITDFGVETKEDLKKIPFGTPEAKGVTALDTAIMFAAYDNQQNFSSALKDYISVLSTQATITRTQQGTAIDLQNYYDSQNEKVASLNQTFLDAEKSFIDTVFDEDGDFKRFTPKDRALVSNLVNEIKGLPGAPGFEFRNGKYVITGEATTTVRDSLKGVAGVLFAQAVDQEKSVDFPDWVGDLFAPGDPQNIGNLIDNVRFRRVDPGDPDSPIAEIYFTPPGSEREAKGSLKPKNFTYRFGGPNENAFARNLILYYIQENGIEETD